MPPNYMFDTNQFNAVLDGTLPVEVLARLRVMSTAVQTAELRETKNSQRRTQLMAVFQNIDPLMTAASSFAFDVSGAGFDEAYWNDGSGKFQKMLARLRELDSNNKSLLNQIRDIIIAETAIKNGLVLITDDKNLKTVVSEFGGAAATRIDFIALATASRKAQTDAR